MKKALLTLYCLALWLGCVSQLQAQPLTLDTDSDHYALDSHLAFIVDPGSAWTLEQALEKKHWQNHPRGQVLNLGFTDDALWLRTKFVIPETLSRQWYLIVDYPLLEQADLYLLRKGELQHHVNLQQLRKRQDAKGYQVALPLPLSLSGEVQMVLRAQSSTSLQVPLELWREDYFHSRFNQESLWWGGYFGVLFALVIYNLFLFSSIRDSAYGYYVLYLGAMAVLMLCVSGVGGIFVWPGQPVLTRYALPISTGMLSLFAVLFARAFLRWPDGVNRTLEHCLRATAALALLLIAYTLFNPVDGARFAGLLGALVLVMLIAIGVARLRAGSVVARFFVAAWAAFSLGAALYLLNVFNLIPANIVTNHAIQVGSVAEVLLLSFALAHRIKEERARKIAALERQQKAENRLREMERVAMEEAVHDSITKMPNAALLTSRLTELLKEARPLALVIMHYPQVRQIALNMGHSLAETQFTKLVQQLNLTLGKSGEVLCLEPKDTAYMATLELGSLAFIMTADHQQLPLEQSVEELVGYDETWVSRVTLPTQLNRRCGVAVYPEHGSQASDLYKHAWAALDSSTRSKVSVQVYSEEISTFAQRRLALMSALVPAIDAGELEIYLQPQMDCASESLVGAEVLLRWFSPKFGQVPIWEAIEIAENAGLMNQVTRFVVSRSLETIQRLRRQNLDITFSINFSVQNLVSDSAINYVLGDAEQWSAVADSVIIEITETAMMQNLDKVSESMQKFADIGGRVALDDFGTGYSSLAYLSRLPIHELKIDNSFIKNMRHSKNDRWIVENTLKLAKTLGLETVAEGIEDRQTLKLVRRLDCDRAQGYYFAKPMPVEEFCAWASAYQVSSES